MWRVLPLLAILLARTAAAQTLGGSQMLSGTTFDASTQTRSQTVTGSFSFLDLALSGRPTAEGLSCFYHNLGSSTARFEARAMNYKLTSTLMLHARMRSEGTFLTSWTGNISGQFAFVTAKLRFRIRSSTMINRLNGGGSIGPTSPRINWTATVNFFGLGFSTTRIVNGVATTVHDQRNTLEFSTDPVTVPVGQNITISCSLSGATESEAYGGTFPPSFPGRLYHASSDIRFMPGGTINGIPNSVLELPAGFQFNSPQMSVVKNRWGGDVAEVVQPTSVSIPSGELLTGDLQSLSASDDDRFAVFNDPTTLQTSVIAETMVKSHEPSILSITHETGSTRAGTAQTLSVYNHKFGEWVQVDGRSVSGSDTLRVTTLSAKPDDFVGWGGRLMCRLDWVPINDEEPSQDGWLHLVDQLTFSLVP